MTGSEDVFRAESRQEKNTLRQIGGVSGRLLVSGLGANETQKRKKHRLLSEMRFEMVSFSVQPRVRNAPSHASRMDIMTTIASL